MLPVSRWPKATIYACIPVAPVAASKTLPGGPAAPPRQRIDDGNFCHF